MHPRHLLLAAGLVAAQGCYSYVPARLESIEPGQAVRLRLSADEAERLAEIRLTDLRTMDAVVVEQGGDRMLVETTVGRLDPMQGTRPLTQRVDVPLGGILEVEARQRDNLKTGAFVGSIGVAVGLGIAVALKGGFGQGSGEGEGPLEDRGLPFILRFALPF